MAVDLQQIYGQALKAHEQEEYSRAVELYEVILQHHPDADLVLYNLGLALYQSARFTEAAQAFSQAAAIRHDDADTWFNLGLALKQEKHFAQARQAYERALALHPDEDVLFNLANCCREQGDLDQATTCYRRLLESAPEHISGLNNAAYVCHLQGDYDRAGELYRRLLNLQPDHPGARHMLAAINGTAEATPANEYVRDLFDQYSDSFEQSLLEKLKYRVPELLAALLKDCNAGDTFQECLDLGCGTGLAGVSFRDRCTRLTGVDLSGKMVAVAAEKRVYDRLYTDDVISLLLEKEQQYDLFTAADLLTYLADLEPLFQAVAQRSRRGSLFVFSTEHGENPGWQIRPTGRFAHHLQYVEQVAVNNSGTVLFRREANLRKEGDAWVVGDLYIVEFS